MSILLAIDTSNQFCSVALSHNGVISELHERAEQQHSQVVLPMVRHILQQADLTLAQVDTFVVGIGPGGFTGVRLAVAVVQGLAFSMDKPVAALSSLLAMAQAAYQGTECVVTVGMDARMQEIYHATYRVNAAGCSELQAPSLSKLADFVGSQTQWQAQANYGVVGNMVDTFPEISNWCTQHAVRVFAIDHSAPHAQYLLAAAQTCDTVAPELVAPLYVRDKIAQTIAERAAQKQGAL